jgi:lipopolysaccharide biosynthesis regulator YciM
MRLFLTFVLITSLLFGATQSMSPQTFAAIEEANVFMEKKEYEKAQKTFDELLENTNKQRTYDLAFIYNGYAYYYIQRDDYVKAISMYQKALSYNVLPPSMQNNILYTLAQLSVQQEKYTQSLSYLNTWHEDNNITQGSAKLAMINYLSLKQPKNALVWIDKAIELSKKPELNLYQNRLSLELQLEYETRAINTLRFMIEHFEVKKEYYKQLSYLYERTGDEKKSVAILESAYQMHLLTTYEEKLQLAQLLQYQGASIKAAAIMTTLLDDKKNLAKSLDYLSKLYLGSQEFKKGIRTLEKLYEVKPTPKTALLLAQLFANQATWDKCIQYASKIDTSNAQMLLAVAYTQDKQYQKAQALLNVLIKDKKYTNQAKMWLEHIKFSQN